MNPAAITLALIFLIAAGRKLRGMPTSMLRAFADLRMPVSLQRPAAAWAHLAWQVLTAAALLIGPITKIGAASGLILALLYLALMARAKGGKCRCLSDRARTIDAQLILRGVLLIALALIAFAAMAGPIGWVASIGLFAVILLL
ncbi:MAG: hypothetical protein Q4P33_01960 [Flaviflexus sp.]|nr:hypothetical protein [Flaviflexus sp.]